MDINPFASKRGNTDMSGSSKKEIRKKRILELVRQTDTLPTTAIAGQLGISYPTLCRDLNELEAENKISRFHGGIKYNTYNINDVTPHPFACSDYYLYNVRMGLYHEEKKAIGAAAAKLLSPNDIIFVSHGTTAVELAKAIDPSLALTVITDGLDIINAFQGHPNVHLYATGGEMNYNSMQIEHNPYMSSDISHININKIFIGIGGISKNGLAFYDFNSFAFIKQILNTTSSLIVLADSTKFDSIALANFIDLDSITTLVTDEHIAEDHLADLRSWGVEYILAPTKKIADGI